MITEKVREVLKDRQSTYEVLPYYVIIDDRPRGAKPTTRTVRAGFDIDIYSLQRRGEAHPSPEYELVYGALREVTGAIAGHLNDSCRLEVSPFRSTVYLDSKGDFQSKTLLRIEIRHGRGLAQPADKPEQDALKEVQEQLQRLGLGSANGG